MRSGQATTLVVFAIDLLLATGMSHAQVRGRGAGGATPQGDILRGEGAFLQGAGWYELNSAKGTASTSGRWRGSRTGTRITSEIPEASLQRLPGQEEERIAEGVRRTSRQADGG